MIGRHARRESSWEVLVTGATGGIGTALVGALTAAGHEVTAVGRDVGRLGVRGIEADLADPGTLAAAGELRELADSLREEEAAHGIRVTTVYPGATATDLLGEVRNAFGSPYDPEACIRPRTLAEMIVWVLNAPADSYPCELSVLPSPR
ncbi:NAD-dependent epimerase/dehydratase family protein [Nonomuraea aridisoli]|uniref:NAD-dependent epimerase/dehydratase domain-containing protein n=1 Tax=Nonomuraea aridisoli TaxID=2070368 RepID=A0A2W2FTB0_9ACTN|nr:NAD-dependent epimerase/dehydratase family protein [Nonomuraea aridisoli]PZG18224.1 hypothetical protein C1J01_15635 [Nonomuraea aridisoli]